MCRERTPLFEMLPGKTNHPTRSTYTIGYGSQISQVYLVPVQSCTHWLRPRTPPPPHLGSYSRALVVSQDRRPPCICITQILHSGLCDLDLTKEGILFRQSCELFLVLRSLIFFMSFCRILSSLCSHVVFHIVPHFSRGRQKSGTKSTA